MHDNYQRGQIENLSMTIFESLSQILDRPYNHYSLNFRFDSEIGGWRAILFPTGTGWDSEWQVEAKDILDCILLLRAKTLEKVNEHFGLQCDSLSEFLLVRGMKPDEEVLTPEQKKIQELQAELDQYKSKSSKETEDGL